MGSGMPCPDTWPLTDGQDRPSARLRAPWILRQILGRAFLPHHVLGWIRRRRHHRRVPTVHANAQLRLYNRMLPGDFLHYGYFDDPGQRPETVSFEDLYRAQLRYAEKLMELIDRPGAPVLDAGSGMGGMLGLLRSSGHDVTGLTPDRHQAEYISRNYPGVPLLRCRSEDTFVDRFRAHFGTVIHSESIQYMEPDGVFAVMGQILAPNGTWIVADYFRDGGAVRDGGAARGGGAATSIPDRNRSGWRLISFRRRLREHGFEIVHKTDITANVLPTLGFAHLLASRIGLPAIDFAHDKLRAKSPALHYVLENVADRARQAAARSAAVLDPAGFATHKRYVLMSMRRS